MKPAPFDYVAPASVEQTLELLERYGDDAKLIAGGQTLGPMLNMRLLAPSVIIDINDVAELQFRRSESCGMTLGALVRQGTLEDDPGLARLQPLVAAAIPHIAHRAIRNRGTVGGSLVHADPAAEWGALVHALDARLVVARRGAEPRVVAAAAFFSGLLTTVLEPQDLLVEVRLPAWPQGAGWSFQELSRRHGDFALAGVACRLSLDAAGRCSGVGLGLIGVGDTPVRAAAAETVVTGQPAGAELFREAAAQAAADISPMSDLHASAEYRRHLTEVLVFDALTEASQRCTHQ